MDLNDTIERAKCEVLADIEAGSVPGTVTTFAELHDHVDANYYGGAFESWTDTEGDDSVQDSCDFWNAVQR